MMKKLNNSIVEGYVNNLNLVLPNENQKSSKEKVLQFGTGVLLRGLPDYFIDKANREGRFNGRIVVVKSTASGNIKIFEDQDCLYTINTKGIENGVIVDRLNINASISRVLSATNQWSEILSCAENPEMQIVISNTTEVGITLVDEDINLSPPISFPGKLLSFLFHRYTYFGGTDDSGIVILPTELISSNGEKLFGILLELSNKNNLGIGFTNWLSSANHFCNTLVDRIVPGKLSLEDQTKMFEQLGYQDELMIMAEPFCLWAIESNSAKVKSLLGFVDEKNGCMVVPNIEKFKELKLRLLNGSHTFACGLAFLSGFDFVRVTTKDQYFLSFLKNLVYTEIVPIISGSLIRTEEAEHFAFNVFERFSNPFIDHKWSSIAVQYSSKLRMRNIPLLISYYQKKNAFPPYMSLGFAGFLLYMKSKETSPNVFEGHCQGIDYVINDDHAAYFSRLWNSHGADGIVKMTFSDLEFWGHDLMQIAGFEKEVTKNLKLIMEKGVLHIISTIS